MAATPELIASLVHLGFTQYEAQTYAALVGQPALTGAEVGRRANVPPSKVYETLGRLESKGAVLVNRSEPIRYAATPHQALLEELRTRFDTELRTATAAFDLLPAQHEPGLVWSLTSQPHITQAIARVIEGARVTLFAGIWDEELDHLGPPLEAAAARGVETHVAIYGTRTLDGPHTYDLHACGASARLRLSGRRLAVVVADDTDTITAEYGDHSPDQATLTTNPVLALLATEYVKADISGRLLINALSPADYDQVRTTPDMQAMLRPPTPLTPGQKS